MSFNQRKLWEAMQHPRTIDSVKELESVVQKYPYFQLARTLLAKAKHDRQAPDAYDSLGKAAVYAPDRRLLRRIFYDELTLTLPPEEADPSETSLPEEDRTGAYSTETESSDDKAGDPEPTPESVVFKGNAIIVETPDAKEETSAEREDTARSEAPDETKTDATATETVEAKDEGAITSEDPAATEGGELRDELEKTLQTLRESKEQLPDSTAAETPEPVEDTNSSTATTELPHDEQQNLINKFVQANPSISRDKTPDEPAGAADLAASSTSLPDKLVTENLAEIMLKQGKTGKAIALYEKLMLKYPEKKTYFAGKIDQLKN